MISKVPSERRKSFVGWFARPIFRMMMKLNVSGMENIPADGPILLAANHFSWWEPPAIVYASPRPVNFISAADVKYELRIRWIIRLYGIIPVDRTRVDKSTIDKALAALKEGKVVAIFPEGNIQADVLRSPKLGVMFLAHKANVPIVPVGISGQLDPGKSWKKFRRPVIDVKIGKTFLLPETPEHWRDQKKVMELSGHELMRHIAELIEPERRGFYK